MQTRINAGKPWKETFDELPLKAWPGGVVPPDPLRWTCAKGHTGAHADQDAREEAKAQHANFCSATVSNHTWRPEERRRKR